MSAKLASLPNLKSSSDFVLLLAQIALKTVRLDDRYRIVPAAMDHALEFRTVGEVGEKVLTLQTLCRIDRSSITQSAKAKACFVLTAERYHAARQDKAAGYEDVELAAYWTADEAALHAIYSLLEIEICKAWDERLKRNGAF